MSKIPDELRYTKDHEWIKIEGTTGLVGVTDFAQSELGEIVFVDLPAVGRTITQGEAFCVLESTKAASDVYSPASGIVKEVNTKLTNEPSAVNSNPYSNGWLVKLENISVGELEGLMSSDQYSKHIGQ